ncbi:TetR/AcrR family transcriptional regulator [Jiangella sp. DSM 45060]|uniref:TetR/AcrR family transcriptional regulator n=1 Tax=Jiangella sp. DSM 45060 TaxID=1798224 RepID=UPI00087DE872|nr:TetR/AcrR family transcriptional regulator [Jiangella sp. DSM 45060]SDT60339.1 DNA-binding transcriptional regulator, AcrR family [Jiangella sp. DSM 45060]
MSRTARKHQAILDAAAQVFLTHGYAGTTIDQIAATAAVSKPTVYAHFGDKQALFTEMVTRTVDEAAEPVHAEVAALRDTGDVAADLRDLARRQLTMVMRPRLLQLRRLVIGEAGRFPELGQLFAERGPARTVADLAAAFRGLTERGLLATPDAELAAAHFNWLVMSVPLNRAMLTGDDAPPPAAELERYADEGVRVFLAAYGVRPP